MNAIALQGMSQLNCLVVAASDRLMGAEDGHRIDTEKLRQVLAAGGGVDIRRSLDFIEEVFRDVEHFVTTLRRNAERSS
jgi:hypothetical protein